MEQDEEKKSLNTPPLASPVDGKLVRQVTIPARVIDNESKLAADENTAKSTHAKRSLFPSGTEACSASTDRSDDDDLVPAKKRVKRSLDLELVPALAEHQEKNNHEHIIEDSACPLSDADSRATTPTSLGPTQDVEYSQSSVVSGPTSTTANDVFVLHVVYGDSDGKDLFVPLNSIDDSDFSIGRYESNDFSIFSRYVSSHHHCIVRQTTHNGNHAVMLHAVGRNCWIVGSDGKWMEVKKGMNVSLSIDQQFRLIPVPRDVSKSTDIASTVTFRLMKVPKSLLSSTATKQRVSIVPVPKVVTPPLSDTDESEFECRQVELSLPVAPSSSTIRPGSSSFDRQYKLLLEKIRDEGHIQHNKKGASTTLRSCVGLEIDLSDPSTQDNDGLGKFLLPLTTLRSMYGARGTIVESMFYLRGEDHIAFLQRHGCRFWDRQANADLFIGYNYGLLTNFPQEIDKPPINQLESKVISKLVNGECSRNMVCSLMKPGEKTNQEACTACIQFSVSRDPNGREVLDLTINQRSSDVILGLPHDVCCWSIILHLVRREVKMRCGRVLLAGRVFFVIAAGGAHVYDVNKPAFQELIKRKAILLDHSPELVVETDRGMFDIAQNFSADMVRVKGYGSHTHHPAIKIEQAL